MLSFLGLTLEYALKQCKMNKNILILGVSVVACILVGRVRQHE